MRISECIRIATAAIMVPLLLCSCVQKHPTNDTLTYKADFTATAWKWADSIVATMSDAQLAGQTLMPALYATADSITLLKLHIYADSLHLGGILLLKGDTTSAQTISRKFRTYSQFTPLVAIDAEWGLGMRLQDSPSYTPFGKLPTNITDQRLYDYGYEIGRQAQRVGINVVLAPVLDVATTPKSSIGFRSFGSDPHRVADLGIAFARGVEDGNVLSVAKHFPGLGDASQDTHRARPVSYRSKQHLDSIDLYPFAKYIEVDLSGIMIGHIAVPALDTVLRSATISPEIQTKLLRNQMGFNGLIFTDALNMQGLGKVEQPVVKAILAGANIIVAPTDTDVAIKEILTALHKGTLSRALLCERVRRILFFKYHL